MKNLWLLSLLLLLVSCSSLTLATSSHHQTYRVKSLTYADIKFQLSRLYYRPISPHSIYWMPGAEGALNSWVTIDRLQSRWGRFYGPGGFTQGQSWLGWFSPYYIDTWYRPGFFGFYPQPEMHISPRGGNLVRNQPPRNQPLTQEPRPRPRLPRERPQPRIPKDIYMRAPSNTAGSTLNTRVYSPKRRGAPSTAPRPVMREAPRVSRPKGRSISTRSRGEQ